MAASEISQEVARAVRAESAKLASVEPPAFATQEERAAITRMVAGSVVARA